MRTQIISTGIADRQKKNRENIFSFRIGTLRRA